MAQVSPDVPISELSDAYVMHLVLDDCVKDKDYNPYSEVVYYCVRERLDELNAAPKLKTNSGDTSIQFIGNSFRIPLYPSGKEPEYKEPKYSYSARLSQAAKDAWLPAYEEQLRDPATRPYAVDAMRHLYDARMAEYRAAYESQEGWGDGTPDAKADRLKREEREKRRKEIYEKWPVQDDWPTETDPKWPEFMRHVAQTHAKHERTNLHG